MSNSNNILSTLKRKLERWELEHLRRHATELAERLEVAEENSRYEREVGESWREDAFNLMEQMLDDGRQVGITKSGHIVAEAGEQKQTSTVWLLEITAEQTKALEPVFNEQRAHGGAIIAQIWRDGIRVRLIPDEIQAQIAQITGAEQSKKYSSARACHLDAIERETRNAEAA